MSNEWVAFVQQLKGIQRMIASEHCSYGGEGGTAAVSGERFPVEGNLAINSGKLRDAALSGHATKVLTSQLSQV